MADGMTQAAAPGPAVPAGPSRPEWEDFEQRLAACLALLKEEYLVVSARTGNRYVQFWVEPAQGVHAEAVSNGYLEEGFRLDGGQLAALASLGWSPPASTPEAHDRDPRAAGSPNFHRDFPVPVPWEEVASVAVRTLSEVLRVGGPGELEYKAFDRPGREVVLPALRIARAPPRGAAAPEPAAAERALRRLRRRLVTAVRRLPGHGEAVLDGDGDVAVRLGPQPAWVRARPAPLSVRVFTEVAAGVEPGERLLRRLHELNARLPLARLVLAGRSVFAAVDFPAAPFHAAHLVAALSTLRRVASEVGPELGRAAGPTAAA
jgi:hypothetical protein